MSKNFTRTSLLENKGKMNSSNYKIIKHRAETNIYIGDSFYKKENKDRNLINTTQRPSRNEHSQNNLKTTLDLRKDLELSSDIMVSAREGEMKEGEIENKRTKRRLRKFVTMGTTQREKRLPSSTNRG